VSEGSFASLNLGWDTGDEDDVVSENYRRVAAALGLPPESVAGVRQMHGAEILIVDRERTPAELRSFGADGLVTGESGILLTVRVADCFPVLLADPVRRIAAAVHAGWRGTLAGVVPEAIRVLVEDKGCRSQDLRVAIGPGIGFCCFEVGHGIAALFEQKQQCRSAEVRESAASVFLDLAAINARQALEAGIPDEQIWKAGLCTKCDTARFYSHRRDGKKTGRCVGAIGWRA